VTIIRGQTGLTTLQIREARMSHFPPKRSVPSGHELPGQTLRYGFFFIALRKFHEKRTSGPEGHTICRLMSGLQPGHPNSKAIGL
jgi:hypothetical protein